MSMLVGSDEKVVAAFTRIANPTLCTHNLARGVMRLKGLREIAFSPLPVTLLQVRVENSIFQVALKGCYA